jgi:hypothetical protein
MSLRVWSWVALIALLVMALALVGCSKKTPDETEIVTPTNVRPAPTEASDTAEPEEAGEAAETAATEPSEEGKAGEEAPKPPTEAAEGAAEPGPAGAPTAGGPGGPGRGPGGGPPGGEGGSRRGRFFERLDANGDGALSKDEMPERMREHMMVADTNKDGKVTREELDAARERGDLRPPERPGGRRPGGEAGGERGGRPQRGGEPEGASGS